MTTSGTTTTQMSRDGIISAALRKIGVLATGQTATTEMLTNGTEALNNLVAQFMTVGMPLWSKVTHAITMVASQETYTIGVGLAVDTAFPLKIASAWTQPTAGGSRQELNEESIDDFYRLPLGSASTGVPSQYMYQPFINYGKLHLWPAPDASTVSTTTLTISYFAPLETFDASSDTPHFPREWNNALIYGLAELLSPEFGVPLNDQGHIEKLAAKHLSTAVDFGAEEASTYFQIDRS